MAKLKVDIIVDDKGTVKIANFNEGVAKAMKKSSQDVKLFNADLVKMNGFLSSAGKLGATLFAGWGVKKIATDVINVASSFEQMEVKLNALTNGKGVETLDKINKWALDMPVNTRKAVDTFAMMQAMGLDPTIDKMQTLVDVSSVFGEEAMPRVARALGQMTTLGKLSAEELNQMAEAGINARKYLTQAFGMTVEKLQKSQISIEKITDAIWDGLNADYAGAAKEAQNSWQGLTTTFVSYIEEIERKFMDAGVFDALKEQMAGINKELSAWIDNNSELIAQKVPEYIKNTSDAIAGIVDMYQSLPDGVVGAAGIGIVGRILLGAGAMPLVTAASAMYLINEQLNAAIKKGEGAGEWYDPEKTDSTISQFAKYTKERFQRIFIQGDFAAIFEDYKGGVPESAEIINRITNAFGDTAEQDAAIEEWLTTLGGMIKDGVADINENAPEIKPPPLAKLDISKELKKAEADLKDFFKEHNAAVQANADNLTTFFFDDIDAAAESLKEKEKLNAEAFKKQEELNQHFLERIQDQTADTFYDMFSGNVDGWSDMLGRMKDLFVRYLAEMAAKAIASPIILPMVQSVTGSLTSALSGAAGGGGLSSLAGLAGLGGIGSGLSNILSTPFGMNPWGAVNSEAALMGTHGMATYGSVLGSAAIGSLGYSLIGGALGLPQSKYSGLTSAIGGAGGSALGGSIAALGAAGGPIGLAVGALAGGLLGGALGGNDAPEIRMKSKSGLNLLTGDLSYTAGKGLFSGGDSVPGSTKSQYNAITSQAEAIFKSSQASIKALINAMPKDIGEGVQEYLKSNTFSIPSMKIGFDKNVEERLEYYVKTVGKSIDKFVDKAFFTVGFATQEAIDSFMAKIQTSGTLSATTVSSAFAAAVETHDFNAFGRSIKDTIYQNVTDGVLEALMQSSMFQQALSPVFYGLQNAMDKSFSSGQFDLDSFMSMATPYLGQVNSTISQLAPAFDWVSSSLLNAKNNIYNGTAPATGIQSGDIDYGTTINVNVSDTVLAGDDVEGFFGKLFQKLQEKGIGTKFNIIKTIAAGLN